MEDESKLSVNRMVEMAMGLSMASLFAQAMNANYTNTARTLNNDQLNTPTRYIHAIIEGVQKGPFTLGEIISLIKAGSITPQSYVWKPGMIKWELAKDVHDIAPSLEQSCMQPPKSESL